MIGLDSSHGRQARAPNRALNARVTGVGMLSAFGRGLAPLVAGIRAGLCPTVPADHLGYPIADVPNVSRFPLPSREPGEAGAAARLLAVVKDALDGLPVGRGHAQPDEFALVVGTSGFLYASGAELYGRALGMLSKEAPFTVRGPSWGASLIAESHGIRGTVATVSSGCSSSANALLIAAEMIERGEARRVLVVGAEELSAVTLSGFDSLMLLDPAGCRPFDRDRSGLQIGEAIVAIVLEKGAESDAGAAGLGKQLRILGGANRCDIHHLTSANPDGSVMRDVMREAMANAGISAPQVVAVKVHGTGSSDSDRAEAAALRGVFATGLPPLLALKRYVGHTIGACGALETAALAGCVEAGFLPAAAGFTVADPQLGIALQREAQVAPCGHYLLNFFGFGGNYTSLVLDIR